MNDWNSNIDNPSDVLAHYGILGMKWGVRRYQNADGSYTAAGLKRRGRDIAENSKKKAKNRVNPDDPNRWVKEDRERTKAVIDRTNDAARNTSQGIDAYQNFQRHSAASKRQRLDLSKYSDQELRNAVNRELLERQYNDIFNAPETNRGAEKVKDIVQMTSAGLGIASAGLGIALAVKELKG